MLSSSLRTMARCSALSAMSWSTCRRELSPARRSADESSDKRAHRGEALNQCGTRLGKRHARHVVGDAGPQADGRRPVGPEGHLQRGQDAGGHLQLALDDADLFDEARRLGRCGGGQLDRPGVRRRRREGPEADHHAHVPRAGEPDHRVGEGAPVEVGLGSDQEEHVPSRFVRALADDGARPVQLGRDPVHDAGHRPAGPLVEEVLAVERHDRLGVPLPEQCGDGRRGTQTGVDPTLQRHDQDRLLQYRFLVDLEDLGQPVALGAHGAVSRDSAAISKSRPIWVGKPSTLPLSPAPAPAT